MGGCSDLVLRLCRACLPLEEVGVLSWDYGALGMPLSRVGQGVTKRKRHSIQIWWRECDCHPGTPSTVSGLKAPLPEEMTTEASLERDHDEWEGWRGRDFVQGTWEPLETWK